MRTVSKSPLRINSNFFVTALLRRFAKESQRKRKGCGALWNLVASDSQQRVAAREGFRMQGCGALRNLAASDEIAVLLTSLGAAEAVQSLDCFDARGAVFCEC